MEVSREAANAIFGSLDPKMQEWVKKIVGFIPDDHWFRIFDSAVADSVVNAAGGVVEALSDEMPPIIGAFVQELTRIATAFTQQIREGENVNPGEAEVDTETTVAPAVTAVTNSGTRWTKFLEGDPKVSSRWLRYLEGR